jgi:hypothetical protein
MLATHAKEIFLRKGWIFTTAKVLALKINDIRHENTKISVLRFESAKSVKYRKTSSTELQAPAHTDSDEAPPSRKGWRLP